MRHLSNRSEIDSTQGTLLEEKTRNRKLRTISGHDPAVLDREVGSAPRPSVEDGPFADDKIGHSIMPSS